MIAKHAPRVFTLLMAAIVAFMASQALAFCASCSAPAATYSAGYTAPVAYTAAYAPTYTTAYAPTYTTYSSGWYPGRFLGRVNRAIWGYPTTTSYAPAYTAAYAPAYTTAYAPSYSYASYAPACSTCTTSYAPACDTCSACSVSYAPACSTCSTCDACAVSGTTCASCAAGSVSQATYAEPAATTSVPQTSSTTTEPQPTLAPSDNPPATRSLQETQKPVPAEPPLQPEPQAESTDDSTTNLQAPQLFDPNDRTAQRHRAPVWTAVYHKTSGVESATQTVSWPQQAELDAAGWTSASK